MGIAPRALAIIHDEHRTLSAVLNAMVKLVAQTESGGTPLRTDAFRAIINYIESFPEQFHHPKEERYLFRKLAERDPSYAEVLSELGRQHRESAELIASLSDGLRRIEAGGRADFAEFAAGVRRYREFHIEHMGLEENEVMPAARRCLTEADWQEIEAAFVGHTDPLLGAAAEAEFGRLLMRIVTLAPRPIGVGPER